MTTDMLALGAPVWVAVFVGGFVMGGVATSVIYEKGKIPALEQQIQLLEVREAEIAKTANAWKARVEAKTTASGDASEVEMLRQKVQQFGQWNQDWKAGYDKLLADRNHWQGRAGLTNQIEELEGRRTRASQAVIQFTSGSCNNNPECDLVPLAQRKLKALEQDRDQLHTQILDLQTKLLK